MSCEISLLKATIFFFFLFFFPAQKKGPWLIRVYNSDIQTLPAAQGHTPRRVQPQAQQHMGVLTQAVTTPG